MVCRTGPPTGLGISEWVDAKKHCPGSPGSDLSRGSCPQHHLVTKVHFFKSRCECWSHLVLSLTCCLQSDADLCQVHGCALAQVLTVECSKQPLEKLQNGWVIGPSSVREQDFAQDACTGLHLHVRSTGVRWSVPDSRYGETVCDDAYLLTVVANCIQTSKVQRQIII